LKSLIISPENITAVILAGGLGRRMGGVDKGLADAAVVVTGNSEQRQRHPVFLLLKSDLRSSLEHYLNNGARKVDDWLASLKCVDVPFDDEAAFTNVNTPEDIQALITTTGSRPTPG